MTQDCFEVERHGHWYAIVWRVDVSIRPNQPLFFWEVRHDNVGALKHSFRLSVRMTQLPPTQFTEQLIEKIAEKVAAKHDLPLDAARAMILDVQERGGESPYISVVAPIATEIFKPMIDAAAAWGENMRRAGLRFGQSMAAAMKAHQWSTRPSPPTHGRDR